MQSRVLLATDYIALNKALGGGWTARSTAPGPRSSTARPVRGWRRWPARVDRFGFLQGFQAGERLQCDAIIKLNYLGDGLDFTMALPLRGTRPARA
ncbi:MULTISPECIES: hypothetical protein [unclassified Mesorhizobium]|uniref:hypothetical protein n=1 Tax=unclassified Mesorhizobium TaxID=325217 RepID=UPI0015E33DEC|nr:MULTISPECIES: hypothetical protein [unclassified Mesorhizobium]